LQRTWCVGKAEECHKRECKTFLQKIKIKKRGGLLLVGGGAKS
jgi:hypothetical protein